ncbi:alpha/beta hydrolase family protein [Acetobacter sp.]|uniref:alpha/beta hydrolase family protein n=1 Tax=Acetobacter sp. TaxID=440 RepID=UPI0039EC58D0
MPGHSVPFEEQIFRLPTSDGTLLETTLLLPHATGPFPLAIIVDGANAISAKNHGARASYTYLAGYFLSRGYAVFVPMPRGFAGSEGALISDGCELAATGERNADDIRTVSEAITTLPNIDANRVVTAGISFGGWVQMAMATKPIPNTKAQLLFFPVIHVSSCHNDYDRLIAGAAELGTRSKLPTLWVQGENDSLVPTEVWKKMFAAYRSGNPNASLVDVPPFQTDSHAMLNDPDGLKPWITQADALLSHVGLPSKPVFSDYLPYIAPESSGYATLDDFSRLPQQTDMMRMGYRLFLTKHQPRAFIVGADAQVVGTNRLDPIGEALGACRAVTTNCRLYAYNNRVVWQAKDNVGASSTQQTITLPSGKVVSIFYTTLTLDCKPRIVPALHLETPPAHGVLALGTSVTGYAHHTQGPLTKCNSTRVTGSLLQYRSNPGFHGTDKVVITKQISSDPKDPPEKLGYTFVVQ